MFEALLLVGIGFVAAVGLLRIVSRAAARERELRRFDRARLHWWYFVITDAKRFMTYRAERRARHHSEEAVQDLVLAGLESSAARERYFIFRDLSMLATISFCLWVSIWYPLPVAAVLILAIMAVGYWGPKFWLQLRRVERSRLLEREMPFLLEEICLGTSVGWEPVRVLDKLADTLSGGASRHPLVRELRRAQWCASMGGTWIQGLTVVRGRIDDKDIHHTLKSVGQVLAADGPKHEMLTDVAVDAHRAYLDHIEARAAALPVAIVALTALVVIGFGCLLGVPLLR